MTLESELGRVRRYLTGELPAPSNEQNTCNQVIMPLLLGCGYEHHEIDAESVNAAGQYPDYTILPRSNHTWYLEAKSWNVGLQDNHAIQAINYAHSHGGRWVILTNGQEWRLFDDHIVGAATPADQLVVTAKLDCGRELEELLSSLNCSSITSGDIERFVNRVRLEAILKDSLLDEKSVLISTLTKVVKEKHHFPRLRAAEVVDCFKNIYSSNATVPQINIDKEIPKITIPPRANSASIIKKSTMMTLDELIQVGLKIQSTKPKNLILPDNTKKNTSSWCKLALDLITWLFENGKSPSLPFNVSKNGKQDFIFKASPEIDPDPKKHRRIIVNDIVYFVHTNRSSPDFVLSLGMLCDHMAVPKNNITVEFE